MTNRLENKIAVITGATSGIGLATARLFAAEGARVYITGRRRDALDKAVDEIGHGAIGVQADSSNNDELEKLFAAIGSHIGQFGRDNHLAVALLLMLGVRKNELLAAAWHEIDVAAGEWRLTAERTKTSKPLRIPLPEQAVTLLRELRYRAGTSDYLFPRRRATKRSRQAHVSPSTLNAAIGTLLEQTPDLEHFTVHDLRRTFRSLLAELKVPAHIAERCMNHGLRGIEGVYDHYDYWDERKDALQRLANHLWPLMRLQSPSSLPERT